MSKLWHVAFYEYRQHVFRKRFLLTFIALPFIFIGLLFLMVLLELTLSDQRPVGYVDQSGLLSEPVTTSSSFGRVDFMAYETEATARAALKEQQIQAYYLLLPNYLATGETQLVYLDKPLRQPVKQRFEQFVQAHIFKDYPNFSVSFTQQLLNLNLRMPDGSQKALTVMLANMLSPIMVGYILIATLLSISGYLMKALVEEKENRMMELFLTALSPAQLLIGKLIGLSAVGLTKILGWLLLPFLFLLLARNTFEFMQQIRLLENDFLLLIALFMLPTYIMVAALMLAIGATVVEAGQEQKIATLFSLLISLPYFFIFPLIFTPNSPLAIGFTLFPFTAPLTISIRTAVTEIPNWQLLLSLLILTLSAAASVWLAQYTFRLGMLRYGKRLTWRELLGMRS